MSLKQAAFDWRNKYCHVRWDYNGPEVLLHDAIHGFLDVPPVAIREFEVVRFVSMVKDYWFKRVEGWDRVAYFCFQFQYDLSMNLGQRWPSVPKGYEPDQLMPVYAHDDVGFP